MRIIEQLLPYNGRLPHRDVLSLEMVVLHCTELPDMKMAREFGERVIYNEGTGNSGHYYIDRDGSVYRFVSDDRSARHVRGQNDRSIGIELVNNGRYPNWFLADCQNPVDPYTEAQLESLKQLLVDLKKQYSSLTQLRRHSDLDTELIPAQDRPDVNIRRKIDPGPLFPWQEIRLFWLSLL
jgi:N-acetylmuramoyl-L-alanine amidase